MVWAYIRRKCLSGCDRRCNVGRINCSLRPVDTLPAVIGHLYTLIFALGHWTTLCADVFCHVCCSRRTNNVTHFFIRHLLRVCEVILRKRLRGRGRKILV
jgi:hypothetical protein